MYASVFSTVHETVKVCAFGVDGDTCEEDVERRKGGEVTTLRHLLNTQEP